MEGGLIFEKFIKNSPGSFLKTDPMRRRPQLSVRLLSQGQAVKIIGVHKSKDHSQTITVIRDNRGSNNGIGPNPSPGDKARTGKVGCAPVSQVIDPAVGMSIGSID